MSAKSTRPRRTRPTADDPILLLDDRLVPASRATIAAVDRGFLYGDGLFETVRTYAGRPFGLDAHLARLARSARIFRIPFERRPQHWSPRIARLLRANRLLDRDASVRLTVSRGVGPIGLLPPARLRPTTLLIATPLVTRVTSAQRDGVSICFFPFRLVNATLPSHKTLHYLPAVLGKMIASQRGAWEAVYLGTDDTVLEGTTSNLFIVRDGALVTPPLHGILPGVTRGVLATIAKRAGLRLTELAIKREELFDADEVFLTASTVEVLPVVRVERRRIGGGTPGPITRMLQARYRGFVDATLARARRPRRGQSKR